VGVVGQQTNEAHVSVEYGQMERGQSGLTSRGQAGLTSGAWSVQLDQWSVVSPA